MPLTLADVASSSSNLFRVYEFSLRDMNVKSVSGFFYFLFFMIFYNGFCYVYLIGIWSSISLVGDVSSPFHFHFL